MAAKAIISLCASALFIQCISGQCIGNAYNIEAIEIANTGYGTGYGLGASYGAGCGWPGNGIAAGYGTGYGAVNGLAAAELAIGQSGGALPISTSSPIAPTGLSIVSENIIEGLIPVYGQLPFLSAVALEGQVPSAGVAGVSYSCGSGNIGIVSAGPGSLDAAAGLDYGAGLAGTGLASGIGYGAGLAGGVGYGTGRVGRGGYGCSNAVY